MSASARIATIAAVGALAVPAGLFSAIASIAYLAVIIFLSDARTVSTFSFFIAATVIFSIHKISSNFGKKITNYY